jgi:predicted TIM-barrel fold metal-dependent hydrolase
MRDQRQRLRDMDAEGIDISFVFPQGTMQLFSLEDKELLVRCIDVYNEWLAEWCDAAPGRFAGIAILPTVYRPESTFDYVVKLKHMGFKAMMAPSNPRDVYYNASNMAPFWEGVESGGLPLSFHIGENFDVFKGAGAFGSSLTTMTQPFRRLWSVLTFSGVLERHPTLDVVFTEGGISWIPSALYDADKGYRQYESEMRPKLAELPSFYWHRQCFATFQDDPPALRHLDEIGAGKVMWASDYPHPEGVLGESRALVKALYDGLGEDAASAIAGGNAARVWGV